MPMVITSVRQHAWRGRGQGPAKCLALGRQRSASCRVTVSRETGSVTAIGSHRPGMLPTLG
jgi:hypothetical protein